MGGFCEHYTFAPACWHCRMRKGKKRKWENAGKRGNGREWLLGRKRWHTAVPVHFCSLSLHKDRNPSSSAFIPGIVYQQHSSMHLQMSRPVSHSRRPPTSAGMRRESSATTSSPSAIMLPPPTRELRTRQPRELCTQGALPAFFASPPSLVTPCSS